MSQEQLYPLVLSFRHTVRLGVKGGRYVLFNAQALAQCFGEVGSKSRVSVGNDFCRQPKPTVDIFVVQGGYSFSSYRCLAR